MRGWEVSFRAGVLCRRGSDLAAGALTVKLQVYILGRNRLSR